MAMIYVYAKTYTVNSQIFQTRLHTLEDTLFGHGARAESRSLRMDLEFLWGLQSSQGFLAVRLFSISRYSWKQQKKHHTYKKAVSKLLTWCFSATASMSSFQTLAPAVPRMIWGPVYDILICF